MSGILRMHGKPKKKAKALPIEDLELITAALAGQPTLGAARDNALLQIGYFGGYRRSELVQLTVENLAWDHEGLVIGVSVLRVQISAVHLNIVIENKNLHKHRH